MENPFTFKITKDKKILIYREHRQIKIVKGKWCDQFIRALPELEEEAIQLKLAKITGHYKHGNEKQNKG